jgi:hypothetical protein
MEQLVEQLRLLYSIWIQMHKKMMVGRTMCKVRIPPIVVVRKEPKKDRQWATSPLSISELILSNCFPRRLSRTRRKIPRQLQ